MSEQTTQLLIALIGALVPVIGGVIMAIINTRMKDRAAAEAISNAVKNAVGIIVEASQGMAPPKKPTDLKLKNVPDSIKPGVQYVIDHVGDELDRFGITPDRVTEKVLAQVGLAKVNDPQTSNADLLPYPQNKIQLPPAEQRTLR